MDYIFGKTILLVWVLVVVFVVVCRPCKIPIVMPAITAAINRQARIDTNTHTLVGFQAEHLN